MMAKDDQTQQVVVYVNSMTKKKKRGMRFTQDSTESRLVTLFLSENGLDRSDHTVIPSTYVAAQQRRFLVLCWLKHVVCCVCMNDNNT